MKTILEQKTKRYLFEARPRYPDPFYFSYGANQKQESSKEERHYSYIVPWQMKEYVK